MNKIAIQNNILSWGLSFVFIWFGLSEILTPTNWISYVPPFLSSLGNETFIMSLVVIHGAILIGCALLLIINIGRPVAAALSALLLAQILVAMILESGLSPVVVRDIGLFGATLSLVFSGTKTDPSVLTSNLKGKGIFPEKYN
ncbi:MAG: hypothetical protein WCV79_03090 [Candidatus Paceibacterota bacterium]|jgi:hypothetical protein